MRRLILRYLAKKLWQSEAGTEMSDSLEKKENEATAPTLSGNLETNLNHAKNESCQTCFEYTSYARK